MAKIYISAVFAFFILFVAKGSQVTRDNNANENAEPPLYIILVNNDNTQHRNSSTTTQDYEQLGKYTIQINPKLIIQTLPTQKSIEKKLMIDISSSNIESQKFYDFEHKPPHHLPFQKIDCAELTTENKNKAEAVDGFSDFIIEYEGKNKLKTSSREIELSTVENIKIKNVYVNFNKIYKSKKNISAFSVNFLSEMNNIFDDTRLFIKLISVLFENNNSEVFDVLLDKITYFAKLAKKVNLEAISEHYIFIDHYTEMSDGINKFTMENCNDGTIHNLNDNQNKQMDKEKRRIFNERPGLFSGFWDKMVGYENRFDEIKFNDKIYEKPVDINQIKYIVDTELKYGAKKNLSRFSKKLIKILNETGWNLNYEELTKIFIFSMKFIHLSPDILFLGKRNYIEKWCEITSIYEYLIGCGGLIDAILNKYINYKSLSGNLTYKDLERDHSMISKWVNKIFKVKKGENINGSKSKKRAAEQNTTICKTRRE